MNKVVQRSSTLLLLALIINLIPLTVLAQTEVVCESEVTVQAEDWLSKIAEKTLGDVLAYQAIADATNAMAASDDSYATIDNVDIIEPGWKLCIPPASADAMAAGEGEAMAEEGSEAMAEDEAMSEDDAMAEGDAMAGGKARFAYVGTYTRGAPGGWSDQAEQDPPDGIYVFEVDAETGAFNQIQVVPSENPSFLTLDPSQQYLYAINEIADYDGQETGSAEAYAIDPETGMLTLLNRVALSGSIPAHLATDSTGSNLAVALYVGAAYDLLPINEDGSLGEVSSQIGQTGSGPHERQEAPHPHAVAFDPAGNYIATADLGIDKIEIFSITDGQLTKVSEASVAPGSGPRHVAFHPNGQVLYVINELTGNITAFAYDAETGTLGEEIQTIATVPEDFPEHKSTAEIMVHPSGKFLYGSNRGFEDHPLADSIAAYNIDQETGELSLIGHTSEGILFPRGFNFDPTGTWLYALNQKGDTIVQLAIDQETGELSPTGVVIETPVPVSLVFKQ